MFKKTIDTPKGKVDFMAYIGTDRSMDGTGFNIKLTYHPQGTRGQQVVERRFDTDNSPESILVALKEMVDGILPEFDNEPTVDRFKPFIDDGWVL